MESDRWGIQNEYADIAGTVHVTSAEQRRAIMAAMGVSNEEAGAGPPGPAVMVVTRGSTPVLPGAGELVLEDGRSLRVESRLPAEVPTGYHELHPDAAPPMRIIVGPAWCHRAPRSIWGWAVQVYAARSRRSWGIGDLGDLAQLGRWSAQLGAGLLMCNPLPAPAPLIPQQASPYYPASRRFRNPLYLRVEDVPGASVLGARLDALARLGEALNVDRRIDRDAVFRLKMQALDEIYSRLGDVPEFEEYRAEHGRSLQDFAVYCVLSELSGTSDWRQWDARYRSPLSPAVAGVAGAEQARVRFHAWLQWLLDLQLAEASRAIALMQDLPIGLDVAGADAWEWQDVVATGVRVGAPPDPFSAAGQDWGLLPFIPHRLRARRYEPFIQTIRASLRHARGLRIDHVMGLWRLFWIPTGATPAEGVFVRYPSDDLLTILALESQRAGAFIVGEDLGTVEPKVREEMAEREMLSYKVLYFEPRPPVAYPEAALAAVTTHDLPTLAGLWTETDIELALRAGAAVNENGIAELRSRVAQLAQLPEDAPVEAAIEATYRALGAAPCAVVLAQLEDALAVVERPNIPGSAPFWSNWSTALPVPIEELASAPLAERIARQLNNRAAALGLSQRLRPQQQDVGQR